METNAYVGRSSSRMALAEAHGFVQYVVGRVHESRKDGQLLQDVIKGVADAVVQFELRVIDAFKVVVAEDVNELLTAADGAAAEMRYWQSQDSSEDSGVVLASVAIHDVTSAAVKDALR